MKFSLRVASVCCSMQRAFQARCAHPGAQSSNFATAQRISWSSHRWRYRHCSRIYMYKIQDLDQNRFFLHGLIKYWLEYMISGIHTYLTYIFLSKVHRPIFLFYHGVWQAYQRTSTWDLRPISTMLYSPSRFLNCWHHIDFLLTCLTIYFFSTFNYLSYLKY
jgi:hypothetical protein